MPKLSDIIKKGDTTPTPSDLIVGGIGLNVLTGLAYSKRQDGTIFHFGNGIQSIALTSGGVNPGDDSTYTITLTDGTTSTFIAKGGEKGYSNIASTIDAQAGINDTDAITPLKLREGLNASGTAPIYASRAWVNFSWNGSSIVVNGSGNVSSVIRLGTGIYQVNFISNMSNSDYSVCALGYGSVNGLFTWPALGSASPLAISQCVVAFSNMGNTGSTYTQRDVSIATIVIF